MLISVLPLSRRSSSTGEISWLRQYEASGGAYRETAGIVLDEALSQAGISVAKLSGIVVTGVGAESAPFPARSRFRYFLPGNGLPLSLSFRPHRDRHRRAVYQSRPDNTHGKGSRFPDQRKMRRRLRAFLADNRPHSSHRSGRYRPPFLNGKIRRWSFPPTVRSSPNRRPFPDWRKAPAGKTSWPACIAPWLPKWPC